MEENVHYWFEQERKWQECLPRLSQSEQYEVFLEGTGIIADKLKELIQSIDELKQEIKNSIGYIKMKDRSAVEEHVLKTILEYSAISDLIELEKELFRFRHFRSYMQGQRKKHYDFEQRIEEARTFPIDQIVQQYVRLRRSGANYIGLCPFHDEKTPSFYLYPQSNRFHCFGCKASGDVITFVMRINNFSFREAVHHLTSNL